jgi:hypothetical protein
LIGSDFRAASGEIVFAMCWCGEGMAVKDDLLARLRKIEGKRCLTALLALAR